MATLPGNNPPAQDTPVVSVCVFAYKHRHFINECLESIVSQQTNFSFEVLVGEDDSPDGTREICLDFEKRYPGKVRVFLRSRKDVIYVNNKATGRFNFLHTLKAARGKYVAFCDGDDFWTDPQKLQKQVSFLEAHPEFSICCAHAVKVDGEGNRLDQDPMPEKEDFSITDLAKWNFIFTATVMLRTEEVKAAIERPDFLKIPAGDYFIEMLSAAKGRIHYIREVMAGRRIHGGGLWGGKSFAARVLNEVHCQYIMIRNLPDQPEATHILSGAVDEGLVRIFKVSDLQLEELLRPIDDPEFVGQVRQSYRAFQAKSQPQQTGIFSKLKRWLRG